MKIVDIMEQRNMLDNIVLNKRQRYLLLLVKMADTPVIAYEQSSSTESDVVARDVLSKLRYIRVDGNKITLTEIGEEALKDYGIYIDGELTPAGEELINLYNTKG